MLHSIQLIERFYNPGSGVIYVRAILSHSTHSLTPKTSQVDGKNITEFNVQDYRKHLALVSQEPSLYTGTIKFNILLGAVKPHSEVTQLEIDRVCRDANILEFIRSLPQ